MLQRAAVKKTEGKSAGSNAVDETATERHFGYLCENPVPIESVLVDIPKRYLFGISGAYMGVNEYRCLHNSQNSFLLYLSHWTRHS